MKKYFCDKCNKNLEEENLRWIDVNNGGGTFAKYRLELCEKCIQKIIKFIDNL